MLSHSPLIVTDGLVLCLDAANKDSYPGTGTTWYDISGNVQNGTLTNGPTYNVSQNGIIIFDGTNDKIDFGTNFSTYLTGTNSFSIECWVYPENTQINYADIWGNHTDNYVGIVLQQNGSNLNQYSWVWGTGSTWATGSNLFSLNTQRWNHLVCVRNGSSLITYLNGNVVQTATDSSSMSPNTSFNFMIANGYGSAGNPNSNPRYFNGRVANFMIYSRALSSSEAIQNYNATRGRFGL